jgi:hypothetical protein
MMIKRLKLQMELILHFLLPQYLQLRRFGKPRLKRVAKADGEPGPRPHYGEPYYGCFVHDLGGHKIEAMIWDGELDHS